MRFLALYLFGFLLLTGGASAQPVPVEVIKSLSSATLQGKTTARMFGIKIYDAHLWTTGRGRFDPEQKFALSLRYAFDFSAETLAKTSVKEIVRVEGGSVRQHAKLEALLRGCLQDVSDGDRITGVAQSAEQASLYINGRKSCTMTYPRLRDRFFGIWLAPTSRDAKGARALRGAG